MEAVSITKRLRKKPKGVFEWEFDLLYARYPRKEGRGVALKAYKARRREKVGFVELGEAVDLYARQKAGTEREFILLAATFFGPDERWKDPAEVKTEGNGVPKDGKFRPPLTDLGAAADG